MREDDLTSRFPALREGAFRITRPATNSYNCLAWAGGDDFQKWNPDPWGLFYWPDEAREDTLDGWIQAFGHLGHQPCADGELEGGYEKVVIYGSNRNPQHVARQLPTGLWTSKLGNSEDIEHEIEGVSGEAYGEVLVYLRRDRPS
ncbi:MAG TPA: hypothetical protein VEQ60_01140 [Longimicrobium sp.]|nr:hypothetical protein [Longimicrobium sp.]